MYPVTREPHSAQISPSGRLHTHAKKKTQRDQRPSLASEKRPRIRVIESTHDSVGVGA